MTPAERIEAIRVLSKILKYSPQISVKLLNEVEDTISALIKGL